MLNRLRQTASVTNHNYLTEGATLRTNWKPYLHLLHSPKNHQDKTCITNEYISFLRAYQEQGLHKYTTHPPTKHTHKIADVNANIQSKIANSVVKIFHSMSTNRPMEKKSSVDVLSKTVDIFNTIIFYNQILIIIILLRNLINKF